MQIKIPLYFESRRGNETSSRRHVVRPLFFADPVRTDESLSRAVSKLTQDLSRELGGLARGAHHESLARYSYYPQLEEHRFDAKIELRRQTVRGRVFCVSLRALGRKLAFFPGVPDVWFEFRRGDQIERRGADALTRHFRKCEKKAGPGFELPEHALLDGSAWISPVEIGVSLVQKIEKQEFDLRALMQGGETADGATELQRVGRCLNWLYPSELDRVVHREREVAELGRLLTAPDRRPVLLVGPRLVGKTAVLHEHVFRATAQRRATYANRENVWLLSPQRLVSGMSYVGQWENRLLAILKTAAKRGHVLYFDDLLGLYHSGVSSCSSLSMAHVLRPYIERRSCRFLAEMTPDALRVFREQDRGLADQFHIVPITEPAPIENLHILLSQVRQVERRHGCRFELDALPAVIDLERHYVRDGAFPGKGARFLQQLAVQSPRAAISRARVLDEFRAHSGLRLEFVDPQRKLDRSTVLEALGRKIIGQPAALDAVADVVCIARARLNDPGRPLASLLFLGPTGVGKTQCAKATAEFLFGDESRLLRFDMNEYVTPGSAARLVGTFNQPEGLLTSAVRRQPFGVVLLDEIEKASGDVLDLLLQVLGEGRLTDALGRTVDFTNAIVVLTSNLGVREASGSVGFLEHGAGESHSYVKAAERFFRPELFNRLDRVIPFRELGRDEIRQIARLVIRDVLSREGLARRKCYLRIDDDTLDQVASAAYSAKYGARALKRGIERQLTRPVSEKLAQIGPQTLTVLSLYAGAVGLAVDLSSLLDADPCPASIALLDVRDIDSVCRRLAVALDRIEAETAAWRPSGAFATADLGPRHFRYFLVREILERTREAAAQFAERRAARQRTLRYSGRQPAAARGLSAAVESKGRILRDAAAARDIHEFINDLHDRSAAGTETDEAQVAALLRQAALLASIAVWPPPHEAEQVLLIVLAPDASAGEFAAGLCKLYGQTFGESLSLESQQVDGPLPAGHFALVVRGCHARVAALAEAGTHLVVPNRGHFVPVQVVAANLDEGTDPAAAVRKFHERHRTWLQNAVQGRADGEADPAPWQPVVRIYEDAGNVVDVRTSLTAAAPLAPEKLSAFVLSSLPLPSELAEA